MVPDNHSPSGEVMTALVDFFTSLLGVAWQGQQQGTGLGATWQGQQPRAGLGTA